jgi:PKHD-type hydroxylase
MNMYKVADSETFDRNDYAWWEDVFLEEEITKLRKRALSAKADARVNKSGEKVDSIRRALVKWIEPTISEQVLFQKLAGVVNSLNTQFFGFDLEGFEEPLQLTNYRAEDKGMYDWHSDGGGIMRRKLSLVMQLTDPKKYEGGELKLLTHDGEKTANKKEGSITVFPSWIRHKVTPVTKGSRQSLVAWVGGPPFK